MREPRVAHWERRRRKEDDPSERRSGQSPGLERAGAYSGQCGHVDVFRRKMSGTWWGLDIGVKKRFVPQ